MHLLPCSHCQASVSVAPSQAGGQTPCPACGKPVDVPTLGKLRQLPLDPDAQASTPSLDAARPTGGNLGFVALGLLATATLVVAVFCGIRWSLIEVPYNTEQHIAEFDAAYEKISAAELIREYEDMEEFGIDASAPYRYKKIEDTKSDWGRNTLVAGGISGASALGAIGIAVAGRRKQTK